MGSSMVLIFLIFFVILIALCLWAWITPSINVENFDDRESDSD